MTDTTQLIRIFLAVLVVIGFLLVILGKSRILLDCMLAGIAVAYLLGAL